LQRGQKSGKLVLCGSKGWNVPRHKHFVEGLPLGKVEDGENAATYQEVVKGVERLAGFGTIAESMAHHGLRHQLGPGLEELVGHGGAGHVEEKGKDEDEDREKAWGRGRRMMGWWHGGCFRVWNFEGANDYIVWKLKSECERTDVCTWGCQCVEER